MLSRGCQSAWNRDPRSACKRGPSAALAWARGGDRRGAVGGTTITPAMRSLGGGIRRGSRSASSRCRSGRCRNDGSAGRAAPWSSRRHRRRWAGKGQEAFAPTPERGAVSRPRQAPKARLVVTITELRSSSRLMRWNSSWPPVPSRSPDRDPCRVGSRGLLARDGRTANNRVRRG